MHCVHLQSRIISSWALPPIMFIRIYLQVWLDANTPLTYKLGKDTIHTITDLCYFPLKYNHFKWHPSIKFAHSEINNSALHFYFLELYKMVWASNQHEVNHSNPAYYSTIIPGYELISLLLGMAYNCPFASFKRLKVSEFKIVASIPTITSLWQK